MEKISTELKNKCPDKCPVCNKGLLMVFRTWTPKNKTVTIEFTHLGRNDKKDCVKTYKY